MSIYQYIYFAAIDKPLNDKQLEYMRRQSMRAEVTRWQFTNEYHYGDFHGKSPEMMRRGYDVHLHYASYGVRKLMFRLPLGPPMSAKQFKAYAMEYSIEWRNDKRGKGGVLSIQPECDAGFYSEGYFHFERMVGCLPKIREGLMTGDTRGLYATVMKAFRPQIAKEYRLKINASIITLTTIVFESHVDGRRYTNPLADRARRPVSSRTVAAPGV